MGKSKCWQYKETVASAGMSAGVTVLMCSEFIGMDTRKGMFGCI